MFGDESKAVELRVRTALEMIHRSQMYSTMSDLLTVSPSYLNATVDCAKKESWSCTWTMQALATVIDMPIISYLCTKHLRENIIKYLTDKVNG